MNEKQIKPAVYVFSTAYHPFIGGAEVAIEEAIRRLSDTFDFFIFTARFRPDLPHEERYGNATIVRVGFGSRWDKFLLPILGVFVMRRYWRAHPPRLYWGVMVTFATGIPYLANLLFLRNVPIILTLQEGDPESYLTWGRGGLLGLSWWAALRLYPPKMVTVISQYLGSRARRIGYRGQMGKIHNGVDLEKFKNDELKARRQSGNVVITVSRLVEKNGVDTLIRAIFEVKKKIPEILCRIAGDGPDRAYLEALAKSLGLERQVVFLGLVPHEAIPRELHQADVFVRPSRSEGMGNSFPEAMAAGLPIIGTPVGAIPEIIQDKKTGLLARVDDPQDLADKILLILEDSEVARVLSENGLEKVKKEFDWRVIAEQYRDAFSQTRKKSKILIATGIFPPEIGGPATYAKLLLDELPRFGIEAVALPFQRVRHLPYALKHIAYFFMALQESFRCDAVYAQDAVSVGFPSALAALASGRPFFLKVVGDHAWEQGVQRYGVHELLDEFVKRRYGVHIGFLRLLQKFTTQRARGIIVPSRYLKGIVEKWGIDPKKILVIHNAVDVPEIAESKDTLRLRFGYSGTVITSVGRLVPWKGHRVLLQALADLKGTFSGLSCVIIGSGPEEEAIRSLIKVLGLSPIVTMKGALSHQETLLHLKASDIFVLNSGYEGLPHALIEAMAMGVPVIASHAGGNIEVVRSGENGLLVSYNSKKELVDALTTLLKDPGVGEQLSHKASQELDSFARESMIRKTAEIFSRV